MKKILIVGLILSSVFITGCSNISESVKNDNKTEDNQDSKKNVETVDNEIQRGSNEAVDEIYYVVKNKGTVADEELNVAYKWIKTNITNILKGKDNMEKAMYYGNMLERYSKNDELKKIGMNTVQMTKYVYRGTENALSNDVQNNLKKIKDSIEKIEKS